MADESCTPGTFPFFLAQPRGQLLGYDDGQILLDFFHQDSLALDEPPHLASPARSVRTRSW